MVASTTSSLKLFYCYAREDRALRDELDLHLTGLKRQQNIISWSDYKSQGWALSNLARYQEALEAYMGAIEVDPTDAEAYLAMGRMLNALGRTREAEAAFSEYRKLTGKKR